MGNCHFKSDFDAENITGKYSPAEPLVSLELCFLRANGFVLIILLTLCYSRVQVIVPVPLLHRQRWLRQSVEGRKEEIQTTVCYEGDVQGQNPHQEVGQVSYERATDPYLAAQPVPGQHVLCLPRSREPVLGDGPSQWRRPEVPYL